MSLQLARLRSMLELVLKHNAAASWRCLTATRSIRWRAPSL